jgi:hypothetical protein
LKKTAFGIAFGGVLAAVSVILIMLGAVFPYISLALAAAAGVLLVTAVFEIGAGGSLLIYAAVGVTAMLLAPSKDAAIFYIFFFGHYPVIKSQIERLKSKILQWVVKLLLLNACAVAAYYAFILLFGLPGAVAKYGLLVIAVFLNIVFVVYDIAVSRLIVTYVYRIRKRFTK